jgi:ubiquinone/menaquinone biosynthesis C-methylase UbiE
VEGGREGRKEGRNPAKPSQGWWYRTVIPALGRLRQEDHELEYRLRNIKSSNQPAQHSETYLKNITKQASKQKKARINLVLKYESI